MPRAVTQATVRSPFGLTARTDTSTTTRKPVAMDREHTFATAVLPPARLKALDEQLASMEVTLSLLRFAPGDARGNMSWSPGRAPAYCRQVAAALEMHGNDIEDEVGKEFGLDPTEARDMLLGETALLEDLDAQCLRLRRVLALSEEVLAAVGSDVMALAMEMHIALRRAGKAERIKSWGTE